MLRFSFDGVLVEDFLGEIKLWGLSGLLKRLKLYAEICISFEV